MIKEVYDEEGRLLSVYNAVDEDVMAQLADIGPLFLMKVTRGNLLTMDVYPITQEEWNLVSRSRECSRTS